MIRTGLLGGSFNPAHRGHRHVSMQAMKKLGLDELWWLVSPGNPLKSGAKDMASHLDRLKSARILSRRSRVKPTAIEAELGTRYTIDTLSKIIRRYPKRRFIWLMGSDNLAQFHHWRDWRKIARLLPIAVLTRPGYTQAARASRAAGDLRRFVRREGQSTHWTRWRPPALVLLHFRPDQASATAVRRRAPDWHLSFNPKPMRDPVTHRMNH
jgi:nicotinate-nucleotide adenylyltransferase